MDTWKTASARGLISGAVASVLSTAALTALGKATDGSSFGPTNAISHWVWGDRAARRNGPSWRYTATGYLIHHASATFWAVLFERLMARQLDKQDPAVTLPAAAAVSALACFVDYRITPDRLKPGFEQRLSRPSLALVYGAFGLGLALGALLNRRD
ncbi:hypothetical protein F2P45_25170 [Massilia sp. CCM 8733]|uniref:DUF2938 domain-containing protein n=1 Tax=Massilia mucilaginosa TaxID=2609282 RepID=A0ABX0P032_9BURK|nr:hypothetical protein [Massilia mucilaginosa]NHZ92270.1 hypothetical protein [Massilia mucilaginosa]